MNIVWSPRAIRHLVHVRDYIAKDNPRAAARVAARILEAIQLLAEQPNLGRPGRIVGTRELVVSGTAYIIPYRVRHNRLEIISVLHSRQRWPDVL